MKQHFDALTGLRAIAASMVFVYHYRKFWRSGIPSWLLQIINEFHLGVSIFFVLSGFLIAYTYADSPLQSGKQYAQYLLVRLSRILPIYWVLLTAKYLYKGFESGYITTLNYTLIKGLTDRHNLTGISQSWSLTVELCFYTVAPLLVFLWKKNIRNTILFLLLLLFISLGIGYGWRAWYGNVDRYFYDWFFIANTTFMGRSVEFFAGIVLAKIVLDKKEKIVFGDKKYFTWIGIISMLLVNYWISIYENDIYHHGTDVWQGLLLRNVLYPFAVMLLLYGLLVEKTIVQRFLASRIMQVLGNASYIFYLLHIGFATVLINQWKRFPDYNFIVLWLMSIVLYYAIEKPAYHFLKQKIKAL